MEEYEYLDQFFYSPTWSDIDLKERSSGLGGASGQPNGLFLSSVGDDNNNSHTSMVNSNGSNESLAPQDASSVVLGSESDYVINMGLHSEDDQNHFFGKPSNGMVNDGASGLTNLAGGQYDMAIPSNGNTSSSSFPFPEVGHMQDNALELSDFQIFDADFHILSPNPHLSPLPSLEGVSSLSPAMGQDRIGGFGLQGGEYVDNDFYATESRSSNLSSSLSSKGTYDLLNYPSSSLASGPQITRAMAPGLQSLSQVTSNIPPGESNGNGKPRVRARRGQATDPHSIAERLRREKIADRMKNLQELLPNPNKTDKASMLDEIIEYVKFLQLQVKALISTSRLGAADAVEGGDGELLSPSSGQVPDIVFPSDEIAFERELVKLMESNVTKAMQYVQTKGLCLMPVGLASAVSTGNGKEKETPSPSPSPSPSSVPLSDDDRKRNGIHQMPSNGDAMMRNATTESNIMVNRKCVVAAKPAEDGNSISITARESKPKI